MGLMGAPMALNCLKAGHRVRVWNRTPAKCDPLAAAGAEVAPTPADAAREREIVLLCVEDTPDVEAVLFGPAGVAGGLKRGVQPPPIVIDHSTISPAGEARFAARLAREAGALYLDAPVSGGDVGAKAGTLSIMCGGPAAAFERARPLLETMGRTITHIGSRVGDGQRAKLVNQVVGAINCIATTEAMRMGEAMGLDMARVLAAISQGAAGSWSLSNLGPRFLQREFKAGFRMRHLLKDLNYCREAIADTAPGAWEKFPGVQLACEVVERAVAQGHGEENIHAMGRVFLDERL
jgi:3-hydroxyisobutyrate dehydrogenase